MSTIWKKMAIKMATKRQKKRDKMEKKDGKMVTN